MKLYFTKTPRIFMRIFSQFTWRFTTDKKHIYLTFDDGPTPEITTFVLSQLKKYQAKATFFCLGKNIENRTTIFQQIIADGHSVGNHTHHHLNGWKTNTNIYLENIEKANTTASATLSLQQKLFRPPYGKIKPSQVTALRKLGYKIILWDVLSADFDQHITKEKCLKNVLKNTKKGSIIVFHDSVKTSEKLKYVLPKVLDYFSEKGFEFKNI